MWLLSMETQILNTVNIKSMNPMYIGRYTYVKDKYLTLWDTIFVAKFFFIYFLVGYSVHIKDTYRKH